jgi:hypothetical protein
VTAKHKAGYFGSYPTDCAETPTICGSERFGVGCLVGALSRCPSPTFCLSGKSASSDAQICRLRIGRLARPDLLQPRQRAVECDLVAGSKPWKSNPQQWNPDAASSSRHERPSKRWAIDRPDGKILPWTYRCGVGSGGESLSTRSRSKRRWRRRYRTHAAQHNFTVHSITSSFVSAHVLIAAMSFRFEVRCWKPCRPAGR